MKKLFSVLFLMSVQYMWGQYAPYFQNYSISDYKGDNQNWGISASENGKLYVANKKGLLEFDGLIWNLYEMPNKTIVRSVLAVEDKVFVGSYQEFGYWKKDNKGILNYTSLSGKDTNNVYDQEYWQIVSFKESIVFRSFTKIFVYENDEIVSIPIKSTIISCNVVGSKLIISTLNDGIYELKDKKLIHIDNIKLPTDARPVSILLKNPEEILIATYPDGCFLYDNYKLVAWNSEINQIIKTYQLNNCSKLPNGNLVFGTIKNGVYITDKEGHVIYHLNREGGLINNTVLSQFLGKDGLLWLGLDNGITSIDTNTFKHFFNDISGQLGAVYDVIQYKNTIYIGSNTGLYYLDQRNAVQFVKGSQGQVWDLNEVDGDLFCGHNRGTFLVENNELKRISSKNGGQVIKRVPGKSNIFLQGTYGGIVRFEKIGESWNVKPLKGIRKPLRFLVFEDNYTAWVSHAYKGLYRIRFDEEYENIIESKEYSERGLWSDYNVKVYKIKNTIALQSGKGWQKYEPLLDTILPYDMLSKKLGKESYIISDEVNPEISYKSDDVLFLKSSLLDENKFNIPYKYYKKRLITGYERISKLNDTLSALALMDGFMIFNPNEFTDKVILENPKVEWVKINGTPAIVDSEVFETTFYNGNIAIALSSPTSKNHYFEYRLSPADTSWKKLNLNTLEFSNLSDGKYDLHLRTGDYNGNKSIASTIRIVVKPPWFRGRIGFALYAFLLLLGLFIMYKLHQKKLNKEQKLLQVKFQKEQESLLLKKTIENEKQIIQIKNENLKKDIKLKSKQLANSAMALVKKNEVLLSLKKELILNRDKFDNQYAYKKLLKQINNSIEHEDEWDIFENNFNQVHEEFFGKLRHEFPALKHKDLKICAYIKMNLSTKEIAPLLNISVRGVETHRYRLKKKLDLGDDESLTDFLGNFH